MTRTSSSEKQTRAGILTDRRLFSFHIANCNHSSIAQLFLPPLRGVSHFQHGSLDQTFAAYLLPLKSLTQIVTQTYLVHYHRGLADALTAIVQIIVRNCSVDQVAPKKPHDVERLISRCSLPPVSL
jgi:hypothetical protein